MDENLPNKLDKVFAESLGTYETGVQEQVWKNIEAALDEADKKQFIVLFLRKRYVAVAVLSIAFLAGMLVINSGEDPVSDRKFRVDSEVKDQSILPPTAPAERVRAGVGGHLAGAMNTSESESHKLLLVKTMIPATDTDNNNLTIEPILQSSQAVADTHLLGSDPRNINMHDISLQGPGIVRPPIVVTSSAAPVPNLPENPSTLIHLKTRFKDRLSITAYFSKEFVGYTLSDNDSYGANGRETELRERNVFSASIGFFVNYKLGKHWELQSGISYSWSNSNIDSGTSYAVKNNSGEIQYKLHTISGFGFLKSPSLMSPNIGDSVSTARSYSQLHYLSLPLVLSYRIPWKIQTFGGIGSFFNVLTGAEIETRTYGRGIAGKEYSVNMMGLRKVNYGMLIKLDLEYPVNSKMAINLIPSFKNTLSPINLESRVTAYPYNFGIGIGFTYQL